MIETKLKLVKRSKVWTAARCSKLVEVSTRYTPKHQSFLTDIVIELKKKGVTKEQYYERKTVQKYKETENSILRK